MSSAASFPNEISYLAITLIAAPLEDRKPAPSETPGCCRLIQAVMKGGHIHFKISLIEITHRLLNTVLVFFFL